MTKKPKTLLELANTFTPVVCGIVARKGLRGRRPITQKDVADSLDWDLRRVQKMWARVTWKGVDVDIVDAFMSACGVNLHNFRRHKAYLKATIDLSKTANGMAAFRKRPTLGQRKIIELLNTGALPAWLKEHNERNAHHP